MSRAISSLFVELKLMADDFNNGIKEAQKEAKEFEKTIKPSKELLQQMGTAMTGVGLAIVGSMGAMAKAAADYGDELRDASIRTGVTTEQLAALKLAAGQSGAAFSDVTAALGKLAKGTSEAAQGSKAQAETFKALGVSVTDTSGRMRPMNDVLLDVADRFATMKDGAQKAALAQEVFGKGGAALIPMLNEGRAGLAAFGAEAERLGVSLGQDAADQADAFNDALDTLQQAALGFSLTIGQELIPILTDALQSFGDVIVAVKDWAEAHPGLIKVVAGLGLALTGAGGLLLGVTGVMAILPQLTVAFTVLTGPVGLTIAAVAALVAAFVYFHDYIKAGVLAVMSGFMTAIEGLITIAGKAARAIGQDGLANQLEVAADAVKFYRDETDKQVVSALAATMEIEKTDKLLQAEKAARDAATASTKTHTFEINRNTAEQEAARKTIEKIIKDNQNDMVNYAKTIQTDASASIKAITDAQAAAIKANADLIAKLPDISEAAIDSAQQTINMLVPATAKKLDELETPINIPVNFGPTKEDIEKEKQKLKDATEDIKRSAGEVFDAMLLKGENVFTSLQNALKGGLLSLGRSIFEDISGALLGPVKKAFDDFFASLLESVGIKTLMDGLGNQLAGLITGIFGSGGSAAAGGAVSAAGSAGGSAAGSAIGGAGSAATGAAGSMMSGVVGGAISAVGSIIGALMGEGNARRTEENTRETRDWLELAVTSWNPVFHGQYDFIKEWIQPTIGQILDHASYISSMMPTKFQVEAILQAVQAGAVAAAAPPPPSNTPQQGLRPTVYVYAQQQNSQQTVDDIINTLESDGGTRERLRGIFF